MKEEFYSRCDLIVPVPLHNTRKRERGYNQAELLGRVISAELNIPIIKDALIRTRSTPSQTRLPPEERKKNVRGAFSINKIKAKLLKDKTILLVDDVYTTGATLKECTKTLKQAETGEIMGIVCAIAGDGSL